MRWFGICFVRRCTGMLSGAARDGDGVPGRRRDCRARRTELDRRSVRGAIRNVATGSRRRRLNYCRWSPRICAFADPNAKCNASISQPNLLWRNGSATACKHDVHCAAHGHYAAVSSAFDDRFVYNEIAKPARVRSKTSSRESCARSPSSVPRYTRTGACPDCPELATRCDPGSSRRLADDRSALAPPTRR